MDSFDKFEQLLLKIEYNLSYLFKKIMSPKYILAKICVIIIIFGHMFWDIKNWYADSIFPLNFLLHLAPTIKNEDVLELKRILMLNSNTILYYKNFRIYNKNGRVYLDNDRRGYIWEYTYINKCKYGYYKVSFDNGKALCIFTKYNKIYYAPWGADIIYKES